jgi:cytochrome b6-f complex iron-sulfur subunit
MDRKEFLSFMGIGSLGTALVCVGCSKSANTGTTGSSSVDFTLDISDAANSALQTNGGYLYNNNVLVARTTDGQFIAVQQYCTHEQFFWFINIPNTVFIAMAMAALSLNLVP